MALESIKSEIRNLTDDDHARLTAWIGGEEAARRRDEKVSSVAVADTVAAMQAFGRLPHPDAATEEQAMGDAAQVPEWRNPGTDHSKMYHFGDVVRYDGQLVRSTHQGLNHWAPGTLAFDGRIWEILETPTEETPDEADTTETPPEPETPETSETEETEETSESPEATEQPDTPAWQPGIAVNPGQKYTHNGDTYEVIQAHTTQQGWEPSAVPALWKKL